MQQVLSTFSRESVTSICLRDNFLVDSVFMSIIPSLSQFERLTCLEISSNGLGNQALESLGKVFTNCPMISRLTLSGNLLGQGSGQQGAVDQFLLQFLTELDSP
jgi:Ran GTPase-activating protein (RanGAP) involved in mRNA processing and transport